MDLIDELRGMHPGSGVLILLVVLVVVLVAFDAGWGPRSYAVFLARLRDAPADEVERVRARFLLRWAGQPWVLAAVALLVVGLAPDLRLTDIGLRLPRIASLGEKHASLLTGAAIGIGILVAIGVIIGLRAGRRRATRPVEIGRPQTVARIDPMLPTGRADRLAWVLLSATAGITEEIMYRGVLVLTLATLFPALDPLIVCAVAVVLFAAAHTYQGWSGMLLTGIVAIPLLALYLITGSLLPGMLLHFVMDARAAFGNPRRTASA